MIFCNEAYCRVCRRCCSDRIQVSFLTPRNSRGFVLYKVCFARYDRAKAVDYFYLFHDDTYKGFEVIPGSVLMVENGAVSLPYPD